MCAVCCHEVVILCVIIIIIKFRKLGMFVEHFCIDFNFISNFSMNMINEILKFGRNLQNVA